MWSCVCCACWGFVALLWWLRKWENVELRLLCLLGICCSVVVVEEMGKCGAASVVPAGDLVALLWWLRKWENVELRLLCLLGICCSVVVVEEMGKCGAASVVPAGDLLLCCGG